MTGFLYACKKSPDYQAPRKKKYTRANQASFLTKEINKEIINRSRLKNKFLRCRSDGNKKAYNEQRNRCVILVRSAKKAYYSNRYGGPEMQLFSANHNYFLQTTTFFYKSQLFSTNHNFFLQIATIFYILASFFYKSQLFSTNYNFFLQIAIIFYILETLFYNPATFFLQTATFFYKLQLFSTTLQLFL